MTNPDLQETIEALGAHIKVLNDAEPKGIPPWKTGLPITLHKAITLLKAQQWISVEDETPEWGVVVLVPGGQAHFEGDAWYAYTRYGCREIEWEVAHWLPLPAPPQGRER